MTTRNIIFLLMAYFTSNLTFCQSEDESPFVLDSASYKRTYNSKWQTIQPFFGFAYPRRNDFHTFFDQNIGNQQTVLGLYIGGPENYIEEVAGFSVMYYLPQKWTTDENIDYKLDGFRFSASLSPIGVNILGNIKQIKHFQYAIPVNINYGIGGMFLNENDNRYRNFFFDFGAAISPRIVLFDRLVLSSMVNFNWDITNKQWKTKDNLALFNEGYKRTGIDILFSAAWIFINRSSYVRIYR
ncbi:MAG: hypothetical protein AB8B72_00255 [Crocinitomicaceae bacterium]